MAVIIIGLLFVCGYFLYLLNANRKEISRLKENICTQEKELVELRQNICNLENKLLKLSSAETKSHLSPPVEKRFVSVIFKEDSKKRYDYFLGENHDVKVGDFVEVYANDIDKGKPARAVAKVVYLSSPGEKSDYAKSTIKKKSNRYKW